MAMLGEDALPRTHRASWGWFWAWVVVGVASALGFVSLALLALVPALILGAVLATSRDARRSVMGVLTGQGLVLLFVAYVQRDGPGTTCWHTATASGCAEHLDPRPWLVLGSVLLLAGIVGHAMLAKRH
jgi:amino acid transporter